MGNEDQAAAIRFITNIVEKVLHETNIKKILAAVKQILLLWKFIPPELKKKAYFVFCKLWDKKAFVFSTRPEMPEIIFDFENEFKNRQLRKIYESVSERDASVLILANRMKHLINRGLHSDSDEIKEFIRVRYSRPGLIIANFITTNDIALLIDEIDSLEDKNKVRKRFEWWVNNYRKIALLISPEAVNNPAAIEKYIIEAAQTLVKNYLIINLSGRRQTIQELISIIENLKEDKKLKFKEFDKENISESGFCLDFKGVIKF